MDILNLSLEEDTIEAIVKVDEFFIRHLYKGNRSRNHNFVIPRKRGVSSGQLCIETGINRKRNIVIRAVYNERIATNEIIGFSDGKLEKDITFIVNSHKSYIDIKKSLNIELK